MKIVFICSSLEPGKDGVGDYVRRISEKMQEMGCDCLCISLNDSKHDIILPVANQKVSFVQFFRLGKSKTISERAELLNDVLTNYKPDICSLQLVIYGYHPRGWMSEFNNYFAPVLSNYTVHLMWHELWIGLLKQSSLLSRVEGRWQKYNLNHTLKIINPKLHHTSNPFYQILLKRHHILAKILPLTSNFPLEKDESFNFKSKLNLNENEANALIAVCFGAINRDFSFKQWIVEATNWYKETGRSIILCSLGNIGSTQQMWDKWKKYVDDCNIKGIRLISIGMLTPAEIRYAFAESELGVALTPLEVWGKSGSIAAMIESGLSVIGYELGIAPFNFENQLTIGIIGFKKGRLNKWPSSFSRYPERSNLSNICRTLIDDLHLLIENIQ